MEKDKFDELLNKLNNGSDQETREYLSNEIDKVLIESDNGEIGLSDFIEKINIITLLGTNLINNTTKWN